VAGGVAAGFSILLATFLILRLVNRPERQAPAVAQASTERSSIQASTSQAPLQTPTARVPVLNPPASIPVQPSGVAQPAQPLAAPAALVTVVQAAVADPALERQPVAGPYPDQPHLVFDAGGHTSTVRRAAFTLDGKHLITVSVDKTFRVWDLAAGETVRVFRPPIGPALGEGNLDAVAISPDGKTVAVAGGTLRTKGDLLVYLVDIESGRVAKTIPGHRDTILALAFSPDGRRLAAACHGGVLRLHDVRTGKTERSLEGQKGSIYHLAFAPDGRRLVSVSRGEDVRIWSADTGTCEAVLPESQHVVQSVAWSPDGATIAVGNRDGTICLFEAKGTLRTTLKSLGFAVASVTFTPDSKELLYTLAPEGRLSGPPPATAGLLSLATGEVRVPARFNHNVVLHGCVTRDGKLAATVGTTNNEASVWNTADGSLVYRLEGKGQTVWGVGWSPDGKSVAWGNRNRTDPDGFAPLDRAFDLTSLQLGDLPAGCHRARLQATFGKHMARLELTKERHLAVLYSDGTSQVIPPAHGDMFFCFTFLPNNQVVVGSAFGLTLIDLEKRTTVRRFKGHGGQVTCVALAPDGRHFVTGASDQTVRVWDTQREEPLLSLFFADQDWVAWTPEGTYGASANGERLMGWQINNRVEEAALFYPAAQFRKSLYHPDVIKQILAAGSTPLAFTRAGKKPVDALSVAQVLPPAVAITEPAGLGELRVDRPTFAVKASARSVGTHPVTALRLLVDGRPYRGEAGVGRVAAPRLGEVSATWTVELCPGRHTLAVLAESAVSRSLSQWVEVTVAGSVPGSDLPHLYIVAVGIDDYPGQMQLHYAGADADAISKTLRERTGKAFRGVEVKLLKDKQATRQGIEQGLAWLGTRMTSRDVGMFFFSGHGYRDKRGAFYLVPVDVNGANPEGSCLPGEALRTALAAMPGRLITVLDACHSGAAGDGLRRRDDVLADDLVRDLISEDCGVVVLSSSLGREYSMESPAIGHGFFTLALVEGLSGQADLNRDGLVHLTELDAYAGRRVKELTRGRQNPVMAKPATVRSFPLARQ